MKRSSVIFLLGSVLGAGITYLATTRKEEILDKIEELQKQIKESDLPERTRNLVKEISELVNHLLKSGKEHLSEQEKRNILEEVEAKIKKLEETIHKKSEA
ncbi:YtxH domain-containing protein [Desulfurobacterium thermolithotrophum]|uniref:YtxH domain-containing protein n=1 Tax=Desulfurobacterium thermolithotrophum TaxID=64160 RepID=UPI0013D8DD12|nr:YtxH domain-containing protein [Desulfurobacterium thermolithotrophum]